MFKIVDGIDVAEDVAIKAEFKEKARLIRTDPITCARYFDHRVGALFKMWKSDSRPFEGYPIKDFYHRVEFQHRGSPHIHGLLWLGNAPVFDTDSPAKTIECESFIDKIITCNSKAEGIYHFKLTIIHRHVRKP